MSVSSVQAHWDTEAIPSFPAIHLSFWSHVRKSIDADKAYDPLCTESWQPLSLYNLSTKQDIHCILGIEVVSCLLHRPRAHLCNKTPTVTLILLDCAPGILTPSTGRTPHMARIPPQQDRETPISIEKIRSLRNHWSDEDDNHQGNFHLRLASTESTTSYVSESACVADSFACWDTWDMRPLRWHEDLVTSKLGLSVHMCKKVLELLQMADGSASKGQQR